MKISFYSKNAVGFYEQPPLFRFTFCASSDHQSPIVFDLNPFPRVFPANLGRVSMTTHISEYDVFSEFRFAVRFLCVLSHGAPVSWDHAVKMESHAVSKGR